MVGGGSSGRGKKWTSWREGQQSSRRASVCMEPRSAWEGGSWDVSSDVDPGNPVHCRLFGDLPAAVASSSAVPQQHTNDQEQHYLPLVFDPSVPPPSYCYYPRQQDLPPADLSLMTQDMGTMSLAESGYYDVTRSSLEPPDVVKSALDKEESGDDRKGNQLSGGDQVAGRSIAEATLSSSQSLCESIRAEAVNSSAAEDPNPAVASQYVEQSYLYTDPSGCTYQALYYPLAAGLSSGGQVYHMHVDNQQHLHVGSQHQLYVNCQQQMYESSPQLQENSKLPPYLDNGSQQQVNVNSHSQTYMNCNAQQQLQEQVCADTYSQQAVHVKSQQQLLGHVDGKQLADQVSYHTQIYNNPNGQQELRLVCDVDGQQLQVSNHVVSQQSVYDQPSSFWPYYQQQNYHNLGITPVHVVSTTASAWTDGSTSQVAQLTLSSSQMPDSTSASTQVVQPMSGNATANAYFTPGTVAMVSADGQMTSIAAESKMDYVNGGSGQLVSGGSTAAVSPLWCQSYLSNQTAAQSVQYVPNCNSVVQPGISPNNYTSCNSVVQPSISPNNYTSCNSVVQPGISPTNYRYTSYINNNQDLAVVGAMASGQTVNQQSTWANNCQPTDTDGNFAYCEKASLDISPNSSSNAEEARYTNSSLEEEQQLLLTAAGNTNSSSEEEEQQRPTAAGHVLLTVPAYSAYQPMSLQQQPYAFSGQPLALGVGALTAPPPAYIQPLTTSGRLVPLSPEAGNEQGSWAGQQQPSTEYILVQLVSGPPPVAAQEPLINYPPPPLPPSTAASSSYRPGSSQRKKQFHTFRCNRHSQGDNSTADSHRNNKRREGEGGARASQLLAGDRSANNHC